MLEKLLTPIAYALVAPLWVRYAWVRWRHRRQIAHVMRGGYDAERRDFDRVMNSVFPD